MIKWLISATVLSTVVSIPAQALTTINAVVEDGVFTAELPALQSGQTFLVDFTFTGVPDGGEFGWSGSFNNRSRLPSGEVVSDEDGFEAQCNFGFGDDVPASCTSSNPDVGLVWSTTANRLTARFTPAADFDNCATLVGFCGRQFRNRTIVPFTAFFAGRSEVTLTFGAVPEPASWAMMIGGFGLAGAAMRRRASSSITYA